MAVVNRAPIIVWAIPGRICNAFFKLLFKWSSPFYLALLLPLLVISHPVVNEITLWKTTFPASLWMFFCLAGFLLVDKSNALWQRLVTIH